MVKTITNSTLSDEEVMQFAFLIVTEKLASLGWNIETIIGESNYEYEQQPATDDPEIAPSAAGVGQPISVIHSGQHDDVSDDDALNDDEDAIFDGEGIVTEAFINGADNPRIGRNDDGTVQNYQYAYARAKTAQAFRDGKASPQVISNSWSTWFNAAQSWHVPAHLLSPNPTPPSDPPYLL
ncbi:hypothetical protein FP371_08980 [Citrobacter freundii]|uniref:hypothetical protein n=1 Tax=Citrobacter freundii TaxID=546 RepID=UPI0013D465FC|nr:hypothetical protein [Citrobacter freundii]EKL0719551.1 hypothetical protein [Citrobacter freundii]EKW2054628.1 hypothetical protein [Citrobacter freundii]MBY5298392.1 hypothetical protein [Citrobacter freundii]NGF00563.1 hypothetical protein [Citrobacter freundii]HCC5909484.1 hypothetical protein [Citrobacter freundii]